MWNLLLVFRHKVTSNFQNLRDLKQNFENASRNRDVVSITWDPSKTSCTRWWNDCTNLCLVSPSPTAIVCRWVASHWRACNVFSLWVTCFLLQLLVVSLRMWKKISAVTTKPPVFHNSNKVAILLLMWPSHCSSHKWPLVLDMIIITSHVTSMSYDAFMYFKCSNITLFFGGSLKIVCSQWLDVSSLEILQQTCRALQMLSVQNFQTELCWIKFGDLTD